ncbi:HIRAN domain-containing protein [Oleispirillum naphthae]|uniref:HIRAN domain-containing protein n=1 Tax=Oleispirillum naphthae TaxID=2838853 RepID=UPI00308252FD
MTAPVHALEVRDGTLLLADWQAGLGRTLRADGPYPLSCADVPGHPLLDGQGRPLAGLPDAERAVLETVPEDIRRLAAPCGRFQWPALEAMRHADGFADFLRQEAFGAGYGFVLACWALSGVRVRGRGDRLSLARRAMEDPRAELLADLAGLALPDAAIVRLLERVPAAEIDYPLVVALSRLCGEQSARRVLWEIPRLSADGVRGLLTLPPWLLRPAVARAVAAGATEHRLRGLTGELADLNAVERVRLLRMVRGVTDWPDLDRRLSEGARRILRSRPFPVPPIPGDRLLQPIRDGDDLAREGRDLSHCVAGYASEVRSGRCYFYRWLGEERATVELILGEDFRWRLTEALGPCNAAVSTATWDRLEELVAAQAAARPLLLETYVAGGMYYDAGEALRRLAWGTPLRLRREPANPHDPLAVEVLTETGLKLGYLPRAVNRQPAELMDRGGALRAGVVRADGVYDIRIRVQAA